MCLGCNLEKEINNFKYKNGRIFRCNICYKIYTKENNKKYYEKHKVKRLIKRKIYADNNKESRKFYDANNKDKSKIVARKSYLKNKIQRLIDVKNYSQQNKEHLIKMKNKRYNERMKTDIIFKLHKNIKSSISNSIKRNNLNKKSKTEDILGCSFTDFKAYLETKWEPWMNWDNRGIYNGELNYGWDIDHIIPLSSAKTEEDIIRLNHYTNLQPLCSYYNRYIKKDKYKPK